MAAQNDPDPKGFFMRADELFIFAGAGISLPAPSSLPLFPWIRNEILRQLGLDEYIPQGRHSAMTAQQQVAEGLAPEPFMLTLQQGGAEVVPWLERTLGKG